MVAYYGSATICNETAVDGLDWRNYSVDPVLHNCSYIWQKIIVFGNQWILTNVKNNQKENNYELRTYSNLDTHTLPSIRMLNVEYYR